MPRGDGQRGADDHARRSRNNCLCDSFITVLSFITYRTRDDSACLLLPGEDFLVPVNVPRSVLLLLAGAGDSATPSRGALGH